MVICCIYMIYMKYIIDIYIYIYILHMYVHMCVYLDLHLAVFFAHRKWPLDLRCTLDLETALLFLDEGAFTFFSGYLHIFLMNNYTFYNYTDFILFIQDNSVAIDALVFGQWVASPTDQTQVSWALWWPPSIWWIGQMTTFGRSPWKWNSAW